MALETAPFIDSLVITNPAGSDGRNTADDHIRLIKSAVKATFPNVTGAVTPTHTELNYSAGVTSAIQTQLGSKANTASPALTGVPTVPTAALSTSTTQIASTDFVQSAVASVNAQSALVVSVVTTTTQAAVSGSHYVLTNVALTTVTLPASPASGDTVWVTVANSLTTNVIARNAQTIMGVAEDMTIDNSNATVELRFVSNSWRLV